MVIVASGIALVVVGVLVIASRGAQAPTES